jgi:1-aminocyclopropane-1-carboxylate deaminase/D-cysteine desulfhydrase-like pyridoxal-dependent ACC family enzyme
MGLNILEVKVANQLIELMERFGVAFDEIGVEVSDEHSSLTQQRAQLQQEAAAAKELSNEQAFKDRQQDIIDIDKV